VGWGFAAPARCVGRCGGVAAIKFGWGIGMASLYERAVPPNGQRPPVVFRHLNPCCPPSGPLGPSRAAGIPRYTGQQLPPGEVAAWGRYVLPEGDVRLASVRTGEGPSNTARCEDGRGDGRGITALGVAYEPRYMRPGGTEGYKRRTELREPLDVDAGESHPGGTCQLVLI
jgi:hypothetical protein